MKIIIATHNKHKLAEMSRILSPMGYEVVTDRDIGIELSDVEENGETFLDNARIKAEAGCKESGYPCIADDSGLCVDALDGAPGIYSARYASTDGKDADDEEVGDGFFFTFGYKDWTGEKMVNKLIYYGISAISLASTGAQREGMRGCVSCIREDQYELLDQRLALFHRDYHDK